MTDPQCTISADEMHFIMCADPRRVADFVERLLASRMAEAWDAGHRTRWVRDESVGPCECFAYSESECGCGRYGAKRPAPNPFRSDDD